MSAAATATKVVKRPTPAAKPETLAVQIVTRVTEANRERVKALAEREGLTIQQLGVYAWSLALQEYGEAPLPDAEA
jgi:hypothetical protein